MWGIKKKMEKLENSGVFLTLEKYVEQSNGIKWFMVS